ncbi:MAG TPA: endolytic transglycosylase MltG [Terriglobales bacterium]|nr:endolytic transglycosylase MltG [Terriglobales bacterium]
MRRLLLVAVLILIAAAGWLAWALQSPIRPSTPTFVMLRPGFSSRRIAKELRSAGVIRSAIAFRLWHYMHRRQSLKAGEYLFERDANSRAVYERLVRGDIYFHTVTIPEGYTSFDIARLIEEAGLGSSQAFLKIVQTNTDLISDFAPEAKSLEGYLYPETYQFTRTQSLKDMAAAMIKQFRQVAQQIGLSSDVHRTVIMASIVEKETAVPEERPLVASVYYNRLSRRMALDADPSIIYALLLANKYQGALHHEDMFVQSPYNTYRNPGLPPGPIANPGRGSLEAAMHPQNSQYFYFVSDANGRHRFAQSIEEHNRNVAAYRKAMRGK